MKNKENEVHMTAAGDNAYHQHMEHCDQCRHNVMSDQCQEGNRALRQTVEDGTAFQSDRDLNRIRNRELED